MNMRSLLLGMILLLLRLGSFSAAFFVRHRERIAFLHATEDPSSFWSIADDWNYRADQEESQGLDDVYNRDIVWRAAWRMELSAKEQGAISKEDQWLVDALHSIQTEPPGNQNQTDTAYVESNEISRLIRCNESPKEYLMEMGRTLPPLTEGERFDISQLVALDGDQQWQPTKFLRSSVSKMFQIYANDNVMDKSGIAKWMSQCLGTTIGPHDARIQNVAATHAEFGTGVLKESDFLNLYTQTLVGKSTASKQSVGRRFDQLNVVWRDLRKHGIHSPTEMRWASHMARLTEPLRETRKEEILLDECDVMEDSVVYWQEDEDGEWSRKGKSSHEKVELADDGKTPLYLEDGDFVVIDEESCIGCMQCVSAAPSSFQMVEDGRARTFCQRKSLDVTSAVASCPVNCMHYVGFDRLKELEKARDSLLGDGRTDHRHFGASSQHDGKWIGRTPLHVSGRDSDANHKSSWYHYFVNKCCVSSSCPERGCYDCPRYPPGENPLSKSHLKQAIHTRAEYFENHGLADSYRNTADL